MLAREDQIDRQVDQANAARDGLREDVSDALDVDPPRQVRIEFASLQAQLPAQSKTEANG